MLIPDNLFKEKDQYGDVYWRYRDFKIRREHGGFLWTHPEYDLEHTGIGWEKTLDDCKVAIDEWYLDQE